MKKNLLLLCTLLSCSLALVACDKKSTTEDTPNSEKTASTEGDQKETAEQPLQEGQDQQKEEKPAEPSAPANPLLDPSKATLTAPDQYKVIFHTTKGDFTVDVDKKLAPLGADRFYNLAKLGFYNDVAFFRAIDGFMAQFGMNGDPAVTKAWQDANIQDDPVKGSNTRGTITFAKTGAPNSRTTQLFINFGDNSNLDGMGFAPFGKVEGDGMKVVDSLYKGYGEGAPRGQGPSQDLIRQQGNSYLKASFPKLDYIKSTEVVEK